MRTDQTTWTYETAGHTSAPWNPYSTFRGLVGDGGIRISAADYDFAAQRINVHDELLAALEHFAPDDPYQGDMLSGGQACVGCGCDSFNGHHRDCRWLSARAAIAKARGKA